ncbi:MAG: VWA-like domain-containing protein [Coriobacteriales bacterium]
MGMDKAGKVGVEETGARREEELLSLDVLKLAEDTVLIHVPYIAVAIGHLEPQPAKMKHQLGTDMRNLYYDPEILLSSFATVRRAPSHALLHTLMHCLFLHPLASSRLNAGKWNIATDIAVEHQIEEMCRGIRGFVDSEELEVLERIREIVGKPLTAERIYHALNTDVLLSLLYRDNESTWQRLFCLDDHSHWYVDFEGEDEPGETYIAIDEDEDGSDDGEESSGKISDRIDRAILRAKVAGEWHGIAERVDSEASAMGRGRFGGFGGSSQDDASQKVDYREFLRQFAVLGETMHVSEDEFDNVFYTYGLRLYGNLPLIEPLEFREERRVREFAVVIDTSGSVYGEVVEKFVETTFDVLSSSKCFFGNVNIHIIQCDDKIQSDVRISDRRDLADWEREMNLKGFGGTDFRPAFRYVDELVEEGQFENLVGLIYFTDGQGIYPEWVPKYKTAFVFYGDTNPRADVPPWAVQAEVEDVE